MTLSVWQILPVVHTIKWNKTKQKDWSFVCVCWAQKLSWIRSFWLRRRTTTRFNTACLSLTKPEPKMPSSCIRLFVRQSTLPTANCTDLFASSQFSFSNICNTAKYNIFRNPVWRFDWLFMTGPCLRLPPMHLKSSPASCHLWSHYKLLFFFFLLLICLSISQQQTNLAL